MLAHMNSQVVVDRDSHSTPRYLEWTSWFGHNTVPLTPYVRYNYCLGAPCDAPLAICVAAGFLQLRLRLFGVENRAAGMHGCRMTPKAVYDVKAGKGFG